ncbi:MAG: SDR family oxidoreductase [Chloroflexi bacterium]|nr:MAG: SDR family oxidoreductase [Chloroflexota bacterium]
MTALDGRIALITGGSSGIGLATARRLTREGARTVIADIQPPPEGAGELYLDVDVGDATAWEAAVRLIEERLGGLDVVHLNAGVALNVADPAQLSVEQYRHIMRVNVDGVFLGIRAVLPALERRGGGAIVATASLAGLTAFAIDPVYTASKHAVVGLVRSLAPVLEPRRITINAVCPGIVETPLVGEGVANLRAAGFPLLQPDEVADVVMLALNSGRTGSCWAVQPGREPVDFHFGRVPGPRTPGAEGMAPPLAAMMGSVRVDTD